MVTNNNEGQVISKCPVSLCGRTNKWMLSLCIFSLDILICEPKRTKLPKQPTVLTNRQTLSKLPVKISQTNS
jgi:hypothetical protein